MSTNELYSPEKREEVKNRNWLSLPRWMRDLADFPARKHSHYQEDARRRCQIRSGMLNPENRGTVRMK